MNNLIIVTPLFYGLSCHCYVASGFVSIHGPDGKVISIR